MIRWRAERTPGDHPPFPAQGVGWQFAEHGAVIAGEMRQMPEAPARGDVLYLGCRRIGLAQFATHAVESDRPQILDRIGIEDFLETILDRTPAGIQRGAQVGNRHGVVKMGQDVGSGLFDKRLACLICGQRRRYVACLLDRVAEMTHQGRVDRFLDRRLGQHHRSFVEYFEQRIQECAQLGQAGRTTHHCGIIRKQPLRTRSGERRRHLPIGVFPDGNADDVEFLRALQGELAARTEGKHAVGVQRAIAE
ncbi:MAG: hypothetical protein IPH41_09615 [Sulfuritalea sp.]|nr:hypothetical protein [Sulfuritalea sp.]